MSSASNDSCGATGENLSSAIPLAAVGTFIAVVGLILNGVILATFQKYKQITANAIFLQALAWFDIGVLGSYMILTPTKVFSGYFENVMGYQFYGRAVPYMYPISRFCQMCTSYITIVAAFERVMSLASPNAKEHFKSWKSYAWIASVCLFAFASHVSRHWEIEVKPQENCSSSDIAYLDVGPSFLRSVELYKTGYIIWYTNIINTVLPFMILVVLTALNTWFLTRYSTISRLGRPDGGGNLRRRRLRDQTMVLIVLVLTYLFLNALTLLLGVWEVIDYGYLKAHDDFYIKTVEAINLCAIINSSIRLINYLTFNREFRSKTKDLCVGPNEKMPLQNDYREVRMYNMTEDSNYGHLGPCHDV